MIFLGGEHSDLKTVPQLNILYKYMFNSASFLSPRSTVFFGGDLLLKTHNHTYSLLYHADHLAL